MSEQNKVHTIKSFGFVVSRIFFETYSDALIYAKDNGVLVSDIEQVFARKEVELAIAHRTANLKLPTDRGIEMLIDRLDGATYDKIGEKEGVTSVRARQIVTKKIKTISELAAYVQQESSGESILLAHVSDERSIKREDRISIEGNLFFTVRTTNCLLGQGYRYVDQLAQLSKKQLLSVPNLGQRSAIEIYDIMTEELGYPMQNWKNNS